MKKYLAEMVGTMVLVLMGCGVAVSLGCNPITNIPAVVGTALAFGLAVVAMAYTIGGISGCHINPAITLGVALSGRMSWKEATGYWIGQVIGGILAGAVLLLVASVVKAPDLVITVERDSYAERYCKEKELKYNYPDSTAWLNN